MSVSRSHYYEGQEGRGLQCSHGRSLKVREIFLTPVKYLQLSFVTYMTDYDKFQSTINLAHTDGGPWMCGANSSCYIGSRPTDSTTINYLLFGGTLVAVLKVRPELARPRQIMSYKWQYRACASSPGAARQLVTTIGTSTTSSAIPVCPDAGYTLIKTGDFTIGGDGTFSISISAGYGQISAYMIGMSFSMSPKEPANDPNQTTGTGGSQETASMAPSASTIAFDPALLTIPGSVDTITMASNFTNLLLPSDLNAAGGPSQNTQGPGIAVASGRTTGLPMTTLIIVGSILGAISLLSIFIIGLIHVRRRPKERFLPQKGPNVIVPFHGGGVLKHSSLKIEAKAVDPTEPKRPLPPPPLSPNFVRYEKSRLPTL